MKPEIPGYTLTAELHRSPVAVVYKARQNSLQRDVLVKILQTNWSRDPEMSRRFLREARACARLRHPNIIEIYDFGQADGVPYIVLEFVAGQDLAECLRRQRQLEFPEAEKIFRQLLEALAYAHRHGVLHRDVKPSNVLLSEDGLVKLSDFGLATFVEGSDISASGTLVGTPGYLAPELIQGQQASAAADLFSAGVVLYQMLTGIHPFKGENTSETLFNLMNRRPIPVQQLRPDCPDHLSRLCSRLLERDPGKRIPSAQQALQILNTGAGPAEQRKPASFRARWAVAVLLLLVSGGLAVTLFRIKTPPETQKPSSGILSGFKRPADTARVRTEKLAPESPRKRRRPAAKRPPARTEKGPSQSRGVPATPARAGANFAQKEPVPRPAEQGYLFLDCRPWAEVFIDDRQAGTTPLPGPIALAPGKHFLQLRNPYCESYADTLEIQPGQTKRLRATLRPLYGELFLDVKPWAQVFIDGSLADTTPLSRPLRLRAGVHRLLLKNPGFADWESEIVVQPNRTDSMKIVLVQK